MRIPYKPDSYRGGLPGVEMPGYYQASYGRITFTAGFSIPLSLRLRSK